MTPAKLLNEVRTYLGGMVKDVLAALIKKNQYTEALNMQLTEPTSETLGGATTAIGNEQVIDITQGYDFERKAYRITIDNTAPNIPHAFDWNGVTGAVVTSAVVAAGARYTDLVAQIIASAAGEGVTITVTTTSPLSGTAAVIHIGISSATDFTVQEEISSTDVDTFILHEYYTTTDGVPFKVLKTLNIGNDLYILSSNGEVVRWSVGKRNDTTGNWTYTTILETATITIDDEAVIDLDGEINFGDRVSIYFSGTGVLPRAFYVKHQQTWETQHAFIWVEDSDYIEDGNPDGYYTHESVEAETALQVLRNYATLSLSQVSNTGGRLPAGGYYYAIRQLSGNENATGFSLFSNLISIYYDSTNYIYLKGDDAGTATGKSVTFNVSNLDPSVYDRYEVAVLYNANGAFSATIIGTYPLTATTAQFTHSGFETPTTLALTDILTQQILIRDAKNLVINRNRLFLSNITRQLDYDLSEACTTAITITTQRGTLTANGRVDAAAAAEYTQPANIFNRTGYMLNETYRFGIIFYFKSGFVSSPYFVKDHTFTYADGSLTQNSVGGVPQNVYYWYPRMSVDLTDPIWPDIDGVPFADAIFAYSCVRQECIPQVISTGYISPQSNTYNSAFNVGREVCEFITYTPGPTDDERTRVGYICPDNLFGRTMSPVSAGDKFIIYGQPVFYNDISNTIVATIYRIAELNGFFENAPIEVEVETAQELEFNTVGTTDLNGYVYRTTVTMPADLGGNNQKSVGVALKTGDYATSSSGNTDFGLYYAQHYREIPNVYGDQSNGSYFSCGHFQEVVGADVYDSDFYGGDTFTQKNYHKICNRDLTSVPNIYRVGLSFYTQNRDNTQMRWFTGGEIGLNYPYQTQSIEGWFTEELDPGTYLYSDSYTPNHSPQLFLSYNPDAPVNANGTNLLYYSNLKISESPNDAYRVFLPLNFKAFPQIYGQINNTFRYRNYLIVLMDSAVMAQDIDQQAAVTTNNGFALQIGDGSVLGAREEIISNYGNQIKTAAVQYIHNNQIYCAWYDGANKKVMRRGIDGVKDLTETNLLESFFNNNNQFITSDWNMVMGFDPYAKELLISTNAEIPDSEAWDDISTYTVGQIRYTGTEEQTREYWTAKRSVPADKDPREPENQLQYWEPNYNSNYTLAFNEKINQWSGFYSYKTKMFCPFKDTFLTWFFSNSGDNPMSDLYEHNRGGALEWYGVSFYAYIKQVFNDVPEIFKVSRNYWFRCVSQPYYLHVRGKRGANVSTQTYGEQADFKQKREYWWINTKNDATLGVSVIPSGTNTTGINTLCTARIGGETIEVTLFFDSDNMINEALQTYYNKPRIPGT